MLDKQEEWLALWTSTDTKNLKTVDVLFMLQKMLPRLEQLGVTPSDLLRALTASAVSFLGGPKPSMRDVTLRAFSLMQKDMPAEQLSLDDEIEKAMERHERMAEKNAIHQLLVAPYVFRVDKGEASEGSNPHELYTCIRKTSDALREDPSVDLERWGAILDSDIRDAMRWTHAKLFLLMTFSLREVIDEETSNELCPLRVIQELATLVWSLKKSSIMQRWYPDLDTPFKEFCGQSLIVLVKKKMRSLTADVLSQRRRLLSRMTYQEYLKTPEWEYTRQKKLAQARGRCELCSSSGHLNVHHNTYHHGLGGEWDSDLVVLCRNCHAKFHDKFVEEDM